MKKEHLWWLLPLLAVAIYTPFSAALDLKVARAFFSGNHFSSTPFFDFLYDRAVLPGLWVGGISFALVLLSYAKKYRHFREAALQMTLTLVVGAGFIVHTVLKDHWGRPRPKQVEEFGGMQPFRPYYSPNFFHQPEPSRSFPCGHCTMGFYFFSLAFVCRRLGKKGWEWFFYLFALALGGALGLARIVQGGHFLSDVIWSGLILWWVAGVFDWLLEDS